jgi:hypothetical protein
MKESTLRLPALPKFYIVRNVLLHGKAYFGIKRIRVKEIGTEAKA